MKISDLRVGDIVILKYPGNIPYEAQIIYDASRSVKAKILATGQIVNVRHQAKITLTEKRNVNNRTKESHDH
jgi:hypothetical protein